MTAEEPHACNGREATARLSKDGKAEEAKNRSVLLPLRFLRYLL